MRFIPLCRARAAIPVVAGLAAAAQFTLYDVTFAYTKADADNSKPSESHYYVRGDMLNMKRPADWTSPVD